MSKRLLISLFALLGASFFFVACQDDSKQEENVLCAGPDNCPISGKCLDNGKCAVLAQEGETCNEESICAKPLNCRDGVCKVDVVTNDDCDANDADSCAAPLSCIGGKCIEILGDGDSCELGSSDRICDKSLTLECRDGFCKTPPKLGDCNSSLDCEDTPEYPECLPNGLCGKTVELGELCDDHKVCLAPSTCMRTCVLILEEGAECDPYSAFETCDPNTSAECIDYYCRHPQYGLPAGSQCNSSYLLCATGLTCANEICSTEVKEGEACDLDNHVVCEGDLGDLRCIKGICTPVGSACTSTVDCLEKDSFCCLDASCGSKGNCIPYNDDVTHDQSCRFLTKPGIFEAQVQCRWQPEATATPASKNVEMPPLVGKFGNKLGLETVVVFYSYNPTVIRFIHPGTCETLESITHALASRWYHYPASADLDGDGLMELIVVANTKTYIYKWNAEQEKHSLWATANVDSRPTPMIYDIDSDGIPEIVGPLGTVFHVLADGTVEILTTKKLFVDPNAGTYTTEAAQDAALGNLDGDSEGLAELVTGEGVYTWNKATNTWDNLVHFPYLSSTPSNSWSRHFTAYADFGTIGETAEDFDYMKLDGKPEIVIAGKNRLYLYALKVVDGVYETQLLMDVSGLKLGGPITIGDFTNNGLPEIGIASKEGFGVYDPKCKAYEAGKCADKYVLWERWSQDNSSGTTGSSLFDFDGDGQAEAVYADECFTRVYDGKTGAVLFSARRSSNTSIEGPVVADVDGDGSAEILMGSDASVACTTDTGSKVNNGVDPIHEGIRCMADEDCPLGKGCLTGIGLCSCTSDDDCNTQFAPGKTTYLQQYVCTAPIHPSVGHFVNSDNATNRKMVKSIGTRPDGWKTGDYQVCRASRKTLDIGVGDLMIYKDRLDRWVSSRPMWNQHAYNIINIEDDGSVPTLSQWLANWIAKTGLNIEGSTQKRPLYNNYRLNKQGQYGAGMAPDITGRFIAGSICGKTADDRYVISGKLCNRGTKPVSTNLPATFYYYDDAKPDKRGRAICTSYTKEKVGIGECPHVGCEVDEAELKALEGKRIIMVSNIDEHGLPSTIECNNNNNSDVIVVDKCEEDIVIVN